MKPPFQYKWHSHGMIPLRDQSHPTSLFEIDQVHGTNSLITLTFELLWCYILELWLLNVLVMYYNLLS